MKKTIVVNLIGGPGAGKSTFATMLFTKLKMRGMSCEYVEEFAKKLVWEGNDMAIKNQLYIFANQDYSLYRVKGKVDVLITDSPLLLSIYYNDVLPEEYKCKKETFDKMVIDRYNSYENLLFYLERNFPYVKEGRYQSEEESIVVNDKLKQMLKELDIDYTKINSSEESADKVVEMLDNLLAERGGK